jgi:hypothetical protein
MKLRSLISKVILLAGLLLSGCQTMRGGADRGHRLLDQDGLPLTKFLALVGAIPGYAVAIPAGAALLPTYAFDDLHYPSGPDHDVEMPLVFAPFELSGGVGAYLVSFPVAVFTSPPAPPEGAVVRSPVASPEGSAAGTQER